ncbi:PP2C family protein-serine/threonine phosphatase [Nocardioides campestrisoli]|uniref:PP2C family protein-serine/threonine phosphatase n=1 Tax=Nocardioides campestrisoli TaxID=2736757 RepID=UPI0015E70F7D|nr:protein phosphatase 2C domain-containing protein [Nocardioides campestrisoli]
MVAVDLHHGAATDVGHVRAGNEDAFAVAPGVFVVADGMGGHAGGEVASALAVEELGRMGGGHYDARAGVVGVLEALERCQVRLRDYVRQQAGAHGRAKHAGTTAAVAVLVHDEGPRWLLGNVGDSRIYRLTDEGLDQVSVDHSVVQELLDAGRITEQEAAIHPERHVITRALSAAEAPEPDFFLLPLASAERLLLCTDGITGMIDDAAIEELLVRHTDPRDAAEQLVAAALAAGGRDNATALVVDVVGLAKDDGYDAQRQKLSLETKLGALP